MKNPAFDRAQSPYMEINVNRHLDGRHRLLCRSSRQLALERTPAIESARDVCQKIQSSPRSSVKRETYEARSELE